jgi:sialate O-acetylesterase
MLASTLGHYDGCFKSLDTTGDDKRFVAASAHIEGKTVVVSSASVSEPKYVRCGWANAPTVNLYNADGLPASPFTSEDAIPVP